MNDPKVIARQVIDAVVKEHGSEVFLGDGYTADETLFHGIVAALDAVEQRVTRYREALQQIMDLDLHYAMGDDFQAIAQTVLSQE